MIDERELPGRAPPQSPEAERSVLGAVMLDERALGEVVSVVADEDFHREGHRKIYAAMKALQLRSAPIDVVTLGDELRSMGALETAGGQAYLASLDSAVGSAANAVHHA